MLEAKIPDEVDRIDSEDLRRFIADYEGRCQPVVLTNSTRHWRAREKWTPAYFRTSLGNVEVTIKGASYIKGNDGKEGVRCTMAELMQQVEASTEEAPGPYLWESYVKDFPGHLEDILPPPGLGAGWLNSRLLSDSKIKPLGLPELLIAGMGTSFPFLHFDVNHDHAYITQVKGDKIFWLYPPEQTPYMYPKPGQEFHLSQIGNIHTVDLKRFPLFAQAQPVQALVKEGDSIFIPAGWWHVTKVLSTSIAIRISSVSRSNWQAYCDDKLSYTRETQPVKTKLKSAYYLLLGELLRVEDSLRSRGA